MSRTPARSHPRGLAARLSAFRERVRAVPGGRTAWRTSVTIVGVVIIAFGILILPLPGPGWLTIFAGLGVLATEYSWAARLLRWVRQTVTGWTRWLAAQPPWVRATFVVLTALVLVGIVALVLWLIL